LRGELSQLGKY